jgi:hypothetical protein
MKRNFITVALVALVVLFTLPSRIFAADTLTVFASDVRTLDQIINADTNSAGALKHVYKLVSLDTTYLFAASITAKSDITVIGVPGTSGANTGRPPCIQPWVLPDNSIPATLFVMVGSNTVGTFKNLYLMGLSTNGNPTPGTIGIGIQISGDHIRTFVDNCVFEEWRAFAIGYNGQWDSFFLTNNKFRNTVDPTQQYEGEVLRNEYPGAAYTDSIVMKYNTIFCINCYSAGPVTKYYERYFEFSHNSVVYSFKNPFFIFNVTNAKVNNNLFYNAWAGGISRTEYPWWDELWHPEVGSVIDMDSLSAATDSVFDAADYGNANFAALAEAKRNVEVQNNVYFWDPALVSYWKTWNDTATVDSIYTATWMNARTTHMFSTPSGWPGFVQSGNQNVNPAFGTSIVNVLTTSSSSNNVSFLDYFKTMRTTTPSTTIWGYMNQTVTAGFWKPNWPLPEAADMKYTNAALLTGGTDGLPIGDPYWFNGVTGVKDASTQVPNQFALYNAYPNPFNPSTKIKFNIAQSGNVSLKIYNVMGQLVKTVIDNVYKNNGQFEYTVSMDNLTSGVYFYTLTQGNLSLTKKMVLLK